ncbi:major facilitator superfamily domain-containing protein [Gongronella butleri]|nr:major facilitator superfamily domain-containing protein [Gongronella butleri]
MTTEEKIQDTPSETIVIDEPLNDKSSASTATKEVVSGAQEKTGSDNEHDQHHGNADEAQERTKKQKIFRVMTFLALQVSLFLGALDGTIVSTCLARIGSDFNEMDIVAWVATAYILTFDAFQPLFSKFSDIFGRKYTLVTAIAIFLFGSLLCGVAKTMLWLIICRAIAGIGAAGIFSSVFVIISEMVPLEKRGSYQGIINAVFALSSVLGPLIGGSLADYVTWRWVFFINLPIGGVAMIMLVIFLDLPSKKTTFLDKLKRIDYLGTLLILAAALLFLLALNFGGQIYPWNSAAVIAPLVLSAVLIVAFALVESRFAVEPIMPPRLFHKRTIVAIASTNFWFGVNFFAIVYYLPIYFQVVKGDSAMWSGIRLIPMQMLIAVASSMAGLVITKTQIYRPMIWTGMSLMTLHVGLLSMFGVDTSFSEIYGITCVGGIGMGLIFSSTIIALQAAADRKDISVVTGLGNFSRLLGGACGVAISSNVYNNVLSTKLPLVIPAEYVQPVLDSSLFVHQGLPPQYLEATLECVVASLQLLWHIMIPLTFLGLLSSTFVRHYNLRTPGQRKPKPADEEKPADDVVVPKEPAVEAV